MKKIAVDIEYRAPKNKPTQQYRYPKSKIVDDKVMELPEMVFDITESQIKQKRTSSDIIKMQSLIKSIADSFTKKPLLLNAFLSAYSTTKNNLVDALKELSTNADSFITDGKWGEKTQKALVNILELSAALLNINEKLNLGANEFNIDSFNDLKNNLLGISLLPNKQVSISSNEQTKRANSIQKHINSLILFYNDIVDKLSNNKNLSFNDKIIDSRSSSKDKSELTGSDNVLINNLDGFSLKIKTFKGLIDVPLLVLKDKNTYLTWAANTLKITNPDDAKLFFTRYIKPQASSAQINSNI